MEHRNRVMQTTTTTGTGELTLDGSVMGYADFSAAFASTDAFYYCIDAEASFEVGKGHIDSGTGHLIRDELIESSSGSFLSLAAGTKKVFTTIPAQRISDFMWDKVGRLQLAAHTQTCTNLTPASAAIVLDLELGNTFYIECGAAFTTWNLSISNVPSDTGVMVPIQVFIRNTSGVSATITMPSGWAWGADYAGDGDLVIAHTTTSGVSAVSFDNGGNWLGAVFGRGW